MIDCAKGLAELTPYEGYRCFVDSPDWPMLAHNAQQAWSALRNSTFEQWAMPIVMFGIVIPTMFMSWLLTFSFIAYLFGLVRNALATKSLGAAGFASWDQASIPMPSDRKAQRIKTGWAVYMLAGGVAFALIDLSGDQQSLTLLQGGWEIVCGLAVYCLPLSWWSSCYLVTGEVHPFWQTSADLFSWLRWLRAWVDTLSSLGS